MKASFQEGQISISTTYRKYTSITWRGKKLSSTLDKNVKNPFVFVVPPFPVTTSVSTEFEGKERLAGRDGVFLHTLCDTT